MPYRRWNPVFMDYTSVAIARLAMDYSGPDVQRQSWCRYSTWLNPK
jgi:hypothetical protein